MRERVSFYGLNLFFFRKKQYMRGELGRYLRLILLEGRKPYTGRSRKIFPVPWMI